MSLGALSLGAMRHRAYARRLFLGIRLVLPNRFQGPSGACHYENFFAELRQPPKFGFATDGELLDSYTNLDRIAGSEIASKVGGSRR